MFQLGAIIHTQLLYEIFPIYSCQVPQQKNEYDCGLFVLYFIERFIREAPERLRTEDLAMVRPSQTL